jgi:hypothetical protein
MSVLPLRKLATSEDDDRHVSIQQLDRADTYASDLIIAGALVNNSDEGTARLEQAIDSLSGREAPTEDESSRIEREMSAYYIGIRVGLRLARLTDAGGAR